MGVIYLIISRAMIGRKLLDVRIHPGSACIKASAYGMLWLELSAL